MGVLNSATLRNSRSTVRVHPAHGFYSPKYTRCLHIASCDFFYGGSFFVAGLAQPPLTCTYMHANDFMCNFFAITTSQNAKPRFYKFVDYRLSDDRL